MVALAVANAIVLATPWDVAKYLLLHITDGIFYLSVCRSMIRIIIGFALALATGILLAVICYRFSWIQSLLEPLMSVVKATPVAAITVILLLWLGSGQLSLVLCFLVVLPNVYEQMLAGLEHMDKNLLMLAHCYRLPFFSRLVTIYRTETSANLYGCLRACIGLSFKSAVAAEIIAVPVETMGERLYYAKIHLDTPGLFAWTFVVVLLSVLVERLFLWLFRIWMTASPVIQSTCGEVAGTESVEIVLENLEKSYGNSQVLCGLNRRIHSGECHVVMGRSGIGKTTLLHLIAGLEKTDKGTIIITPHQNAVHGQKIPFGMVFQDEVVLNTYTALQNIEICAGRRLTSEELHDFKLLLPEDALHKKADQLSGGMKRRVQIARALFSPASVLLMDEPFRGLDEGTKETCISFIKKYRMGRTMIVSAHDEADAECLGGIIWKPE